MMSEWPSLSADALEIGCDILMPFWQMLIACELQAIYLPPYGFKGNLLLADFSR
jgi:hypothetical protein